jgi:hypothetical protein
MLDAYLMEFYSVVVKPVVHSWLSCIVQLYWKNVTWMVGMMALDAFSFLHTDLFHSIPL